MQLQKYEDRTRNNVSDSTLKSQMSALRRYSKFIGDEEPSVENVEEWVDHLIEQHDKGNIKASTISQYFKAVKYYFEKVRNQYGDLEHISRWLPDKDVDPGDYLTNREWELLRNSIYNVRDRAFIELMYHYARRPGEIILLNTEDIDMEEDTITFSILKKSDPTIIQLLELEDGTEHKIFRATFELEEEPKEHIERYMKYRIDAEEEIKINGEEKTVHPLFTTGEGRINYHTIRKATKKYCERVGIEKNITPKGMRHSRATHLDWAGHSPHEIARHQLVHDPETDVIGAYIHDRDEEQIREVLSTDE